MAAINWTAQDIQRIERNVNAQSIEKHPVHRYPQYAAIGEDVQAEDYSLASLVTYLKETQPRGWLVIRAYPDARRQKITLFRQGNVPTEWQ